MSQVELEQDEPIIELNEEIEATEYSIGYSIDDNEIRIQMHNDFGTISSFVTDAVGAYEFAQRVLRAYDKLEGL